MGAGEGDADDDAWKEDVVALLVAEVDEEVSIVSGSGGLISIIKLVFPWTAFEALICLLDLA